MNNESQNVEYKESWRDEYLKWICGFANAQGGTIYIGVSDKLEIIGCDDSKRLLEDIPNKVRDILGIIVDVNLLKGNGKEYIEIAVSQSNVPISYKGQYHYRSGSTKQELKGTALQQFILKKMGRQWDDVAHESATIDCIDPKAIKYFIIQGIKSSRITDDSFGDSDAEILENLNLLTDDNKLKYAAILLFAKKPQKYFTGVQFKIGRFGHDETDLMFQDVVEGNILQMADAVIKLLKSKYLKSPIHYEGMTRVEKLEIPEDALRELIYNSIIHKQYGGAPIQMRVFNNCIELWNEGRLPEGYSVATLMQKHSSKPRNHNIAEVFYKAGFIESWGRGIKKVCEEIKQNGLPEPTFTEHCGGLLVTIMRPQKENGKTETGNSKTDKIINLLRNNPKMTINNLAQEMGMSRNGVVYYLDKLQNEGKLIRIGNSFGGQWQTID